MFSLVENEQINYLKFVQHSWRTDQGREGGREGGRERGRERVMEGVSERKWREEK